MLLPVRNTQATAKRLKLRRLAGARPFLRSRLPEKPALAFVRRIVEHQM